MYCIVLYVITMYCAAYSGVGSIHTIPYHAHDFISGSHLLFVFDFVFTGMVPEPFIRIFSTINRAQFESINEKYKGQQLIKDITSKLGGDFENAVLTMCADKYEFFAGKVEKCLKGYSADKDGLCR